MRLRKQQFDFLPGQSRAPHFSMLQFVRDFKRKCYLNITIRKKLQGLFSSLYCNIISYNNGTYSPYSIVTFVTMLPQAPSLSGYQQALREQMT